MGINKEQHDKLYPKIVTKQHGEFCLGCGARPQAKCSYLEEPEGIPTHTKLKVFFITNKDKTKLLGLIIDHIDNDDHNNDISNLQLFCRTCNQIKNPRQKKNTLPAREKPPEMKRGDEQEDRFRAWLNGEVTVIHSQPFIRDEEAIYGGAEALTNFSDGDTISPITTRRYLKKLTSGEGMYYWFKGFVGLKTQLPFLEEWIIEKERQKQRKIKKVQELHDTYVKEFKE